MVVRRHTASHSSNQQDIRPGSNWYHRSRTTNKHTPHDAHSTLVATWQRMSLGHCPRLAESALTEPCQDSSNSGTGDDDRASARTDSSMRRTCGSDPPACCSGNLIVPRPGLWGTFLMVPQSGLAFGVHRHTHTVFTSSGCIERHGSRLSVLTRVLPGVY
jgi:hypothetical protein